MTLPLSFDAIQAALVPVAELQERFAISDKQIADWLKAARKAKEADKAAAEREAQQAAMAAQRAAEAADREAQKAARAAENEARVAKQVAEGEARRAARRAQIRAERLQAKQDEADAKAAQRSRQEAYSRRLTNEEILWLNNDDYKTPLLEIASRWGIDPERIRTFDRDPINGRHATRPEGTPRVTPIPATHQVQ